MCSSGLRAEWVPKAEQKRISEMKKHPLVKQRSGGCGTREYYIVHVSLASKSNMKLLRARNIRG